MLIVNVIIGLVPSAITLVFINLEALSAYFSFRRQIKPELPETRALKFLEGQSLVWNNPFFLGLAVARSISPSIFAEYLHNGDLQSWCLCAIRLLALALCIFVWRHLFINKYNNAGHFLRHRFRSQILSFLFNCNVFFGSLYIYIVMASPLTNAFIEFFKTHYVQNLTFIIFLLVTSFGGFSVTIFAVVIHALLDIFGKIIVFTSFSSVETVGKELLATPIAPCFSNLAICEFIPALSLFLTVLPTYSILRTAKNVQQMTLSAGIGMFVLICDHLWLTLLVPNVKEVGVQITEGQKDVDDNITLWVRSFLERFDNDLSSNFDERKITWSPSVDIGTLRLQKEFWNFSPFAAIVHFWCITASLNTFSTIQLHALTIHLIENCIPSWFREAVMSSVKELRVIYIGIRFLLTIILVLITGVITSDLSEAHFKGKVFFVPLNESTLTTAVMFVVLTAWALESVDSRVLIVLAFLQTVAVAFVRQILAINVHLGEHEMDEGDLHKEGKLEWTHICTTAWAPAIVAVVIFIVLIPALAFSIRSRRILHPREFKTAVESVSSEGDSEDSNDLVEM